MRVAFITVGDTGRKTGGYVYNARVISGLRERGFKVEEIVVCGASPEEQRTAAPRLGSAFDPSKYDAVVVDALARIAVSPHLDLWRASRPVVALVHELPSVVGGGTDHERVHEEPLMRADRLVAVSSHGMNMLQGCGVSPERIQVVPPGFDGLPEGDGGRTRRQDFVRALCVAQWIPRKEILALVEAWTLHERPGAVLELLGETDADREYETRVRAAIEAAPQHSIVVSGRVNDATLARAYALADLFVLPSRYEGYGIVCAEALASGLPVIACNVGPIPELVGTEAAVLVPPEDKKALSAALDLLLGDAGIRTRMSEAAKRRATHLPCWEDTVTGFENAVKIAANSSPEARNLLTKRKMPARR